MKAGPHLLPVVFRAPNIPVTLKASYIAAVVIFAAVNSAASAQTIDLLCRERAAPSDRDHP